MTIPADPRGTILAVPGRAATSFHVRGCRCGYCPDAEAAHAEAEACAQRVIAALGGR